MGSILGQNLIITKDLLSLTAASRYKMRDINRKRVKGMLKTGAISDISKISL